MARCTVERLMRELGLSGARRGKAFKVTTRLRRAPAPPGRPGRAGLPGAGAEPPVGRRPHLREDPCAAGCTRRSSSTSTRGWWSAGRSPTRCAPTWPSTRLEMAVWNRTRAGQILDGLVHHSATGACNICAIRYSRAARRERHRRLGRIAAATATTTPWPRRSTASTSGSSSTPKAHGRGLDDVEFATLGYIDWFNHRRLHGEITDDNSYVTPAEFEALYYRQTAARPRGGHPIARAVTKPGAVHDLSTSSVVTPRPGGRLGKCS